MMMEMTKAFKTAELQRYILIAFPPIQLHDSMENGTWDVFKTMFPEANGS